MFIQLILCDVVNNFVPVRVWFGVSTCTKSALHPVKNVWVTAFCSPDHSLQKEVTHTFYGVESAFWRNTTLSVPPLYVCGGADACSPALFNMAVFAGWVFGLLLTLHSLVSSLVLVFDPSFFSFSFDQIFWHWFGLFQFALIFGFSALCWFDSFDPMLSLVLGPWRTVVYFSEWYVLIS